MKARSLAWLFTLVVVTGHGSLRAEDSTTHWNQFRGSHGDGASVANDLPLEFEEKHNVRWKVAIRDEGWSSPVVWGDPSVREKVESGGATKEQVIAWMKWQARIKGKRDGK